MLTNPVYAGRIRHLVNIYLGQHSSVIDPAVWSSVQAQVRSDAAKDRTFTKRNRNGARKAASLPAGKIYDQTGDHLTRSHSITVKGRRLRYYVSHRLVLETAPEL